jgi:hypothetical protein
LRNSHEASHRAGKHDYDVDHGVDKFADIHDKGCPYLYIPFRDCTDMDTNFAPGGPCKPVPPPQSTPKEKISEENLKRFPPERFCSATHNRNRKYECRNNVWSLCATIGAWCPPEKRQEPCIPHVSPHNFGQPNFGSDCEVPGAQCRVCVNVNCTVSSTHGGGLHNVRHCDRDLKMWVPCVGLSP